MTQHKLSGKPYRPSNGTEGEIFQHNFCLNCIHENLESETWCEILTRTMYYKVTDASYPTEWIHNDEGEPTCTNFAPSVDSPEYARQQRAKQIASGQLELFT